MKDSLLLLATGLGLSMTSWAFWHYLGDHAFGVLNTVVLVAIAADNFRLRRQLRAMRGGPLK